MSVIIKPTTANIIGFWFSVDTPLRRLKINHNAELWHACQTISSHFRPASQVKQIELYRHADKAAFAKAVQQELAQTQSKRPDQVTVAPSHDGMN